MPRVRRPRPEPEDNRRPSEIAREASDAKIVALLLMGHKIADVVDQLAMGRDMVNRRLADPAFRALLEQERTEVLRSVTDLLSAEAYKSVEALVRIRDDTEASSASRVRAAVEILKLVFGEGPKVELHQTNVTMGGGGPSPADRLAQFLDKLRDRGDQVAALVEAIEVQEVQPELPPGDDVEVPDGEDQ